MIATMDVEQETGQAAGVDAPASGPVTLRQIQAAQRAVQRAKEDGAKRAAEKSDARDDLVRAAIAEGVATKAEIARLLGLSDMQVSRIARGQRSGKTRPE